MISRGFAAAAGFFLLCAASPAFAQQSMIAAPLPTPVMAPTPKAITAPPAHKVADTHIESTKLGFDKGVGPAVGRNVSWRGKEYEVTDIEVDGGGPSFSGNSKFVIAPQGKGLRIGLKEIDAPKMAALVDKTKG